ncbi:MAG TPA: alpha/beta hydrolase, partial [Dehalococcoidia bacterium]
MAEPQIQYARTSDGVNIAYYAIGNGPPLIATSATLGMAVAKEWTMPAIRRIAELSSQVFTYIRFDPHGSGMSDRADADLSVESFVRDLEAVADAAAPDRFALFANGVMTAPAIVYAARHPDRLTHLLLWMVYAHRGDLETPHREQIVNLALTDWRAATESGMRASDNWEHEEMASQMAAITRESVTPETFVKFEKEWPTWDVSEYLPEIATPALILHPRNHPYYGSDAARRVAAAIPGSRLALVDSSTVLFPDAKIAVIAGEFLGTITPRSEGRPPVNVAHSGTAIILFADIADSTALTERMGDAAFREKARALDDA